MRAAEFTKKLTVLDSLRMQKEAWNRITASTIVSCYRRASFIKEDNNADDASLSAASDVASDDFDLPPGMTSDEFTEYVAVDNDLPVLDDCTVTDTAAGWHLPAMSPTTRMTTPSRATLMKDTRRSASLMQLRVSGHFARIWRPTAARTIACCTAWPTTSMTVIDSRASRSQSRIIFLFRPNSRVFQ